ncbi:MAG: (2Fe-2S)-binding protein [Acidobacteria bacterium]|nr:(2Fe-2S)-binding protein [Acidobacteriota bacterium]
MASIKLTVNGTAHTVDVADPEMPLLYVLMDDLQLNGPKYGCGLSQCGACTVLLDGEPIRSCQTPVSLAAGHDVLTIEGLGTMENPHRIQQLFMDEQAVQCGYCISGPMLYGKVFIDQNPGSSQEQILEALSGLLCRCHAHTRMMRALTRYSEEVKA